MRRGYALLVLAGCGFNAAHPDGGIVLPDGGTAETHAFSVIELRAGQVANMTVDAPRLALTPNAYVYGGLIAHGLQGLRLWTRGDTGWSKLDGKAPTGAGLWRGEPLPGNADLRHLGITDQGDMTIWFEGEVWLDANSDEKFTISADDMAFVDLALPGTTDYMLQTENNNTVDVSTPQSGWYPIRVGYGNADRGSNFIFTHREKGGPPILWTRDRLRARASELGGMMRTVYGHQILGGGANGQPPVTRFEQGDLLTMVTFGTQQGAGNDDWSARYLGQVYVDKSGEYTLTIDSHDGNRGRLGGIRSQAHWTRDDNVAMGDPAVTSTVKATLTPGWNDVTVDYNAVLNTKDLHVQLQAPDSQMAFVVPRDQLRPVESVDDRLAVGFDETNHTVKDGQGMNGEGTAEMTVAGYSGETVDSIELTYQATSQQWGDLRIALETPGGRRVSLPDPGSLPDGDHTLQFTIPASATDGTAALLGGAPNGDWKFHMLDQNGGGGDGQLGAARLTLHTRGGPDKIARNATWTSAPLDAVTNLIALDAISWTERVPDGASVKVSFRACQTANCSDNPKWSDPVINGAGAAVPAVRYLQLQVEMTSNGLLEPQLGKLTVAYRRSL